MLFPTEEYLSEICSNSLKSGSNRQRIVEEFLQKLNWKYSLEILNNGNTQKFTNIRIDVIQSKTSCERIILLAHYDVFNSASENCLDNSASIVNLLHVIELFRQNKLSNLKRSLSIVFTDGEECGGKGAADLSRRITEGSYGTVPLAINLDWTGCGEDIAIEEIELKNLSAHLMNSLQACETFMPFNDAVILRRNNIHSVTLAIGQRHNGSFFLKNLHLMHTKNDTFSLVNIIDMNRFVDLLYTTLIENIL